MKKAFSLFLAMVLLMATASPALAAEGTTVSPCYVNATQASVTLVFTDDGEASWTIICIGKSTATGIHAVTYLERLVGSTWVRVDLGNTNDEYTYDITTRYLTKTYTYPISTAGSYRAVVEFTVYGTVEDETITLWKQYDYNPS